MDSPTPSPVSVTHRPTSLPRKIPTGSPMTNNATLANGLRIVRMRFLAEKKDRGIAAAVPSVVATRASIKVSMIRRHESRAVSLHIHEPMRSRVVKRSP